MNWFKTVQQKISSKLEDKKLANELADKIEFYKDKNLGFTCELLLRYMQTKELKRTGLLYSHHQLENMAAIEYERLKSVGYIDDLESIREDICKQMQEEAESIY